MASVLVCSCPVIGHVVPMLAVAAGLVNRGHTVRFLTGQRYADRVTATGATFLPLPPDADFDDTNPDEEFPDRVGLKGPAGIRYDLTNILMRPGKHQYDAVQSAIASTPADAVLCDPLFMGAALLLNTPRANRPAVVNCGITPLSLSSRDAAPFGLGIPPLRGPIGRVRNRALEVMAERVISSSASPSSSTHAPTFPTLSTSSAPSRRAGVRTTRTQLCPNGGQTSTPATRSSTSPRALSPTATTTTHPPHHRRTRERRRPRRRQHRRSARGHAHRTASRARPGLLLPPLRRLLPKTSVLVTNGGYGGVQFALRHGVPLVVARQSEEKVEVTARVAWSRTGINLKTNRAKPDDVAKAGRKVLAEPSYRQHAEGIGKAIKGPRGVGATVDLVEELKPAG